MAEESQEEIRQRMTLDAEQVLKTLSSLDSGFQSLEKRLSSVATNFTLWSGRTDAITESLRNLTHAASDALAVTSRLSSVRMPSAQTSRSSRQTQPSDAFALDRLLGGGNSVAENVYKTATQKPAVSKSALKEFKQEQQEAQKLVESLRTPWESHNARLATYQSMLHKGTIDQTTFNRAVAQSHEAFNKATASTNNWLLTWETVGRVIQTQLLVRSLNAIRDAAGEAYESQLKLAKAVNEIRAIDPNRSYNQIASSLRSYSDQFNQPIDKVAEAQYQTISDQFTTAKQQADILTAANQLAKTSSSDLNISVELLTGALNAYGESSETAGLRAAQFFKTIELGRLRAGELGTALGRTQTIGHELGISLEELQAALVSTTIGGVKANEAATQLRGIMSALLKPSDSMKAAFKEIGVESGEAAIATFGFMGTLQQLDRVSGSASGMSKLFPNVRGLAGALRIANEGSQQYKEAEAELYRVNNEVLQKKVEEYNATDAAKTTDAINKLKNALTVDLGSNLVSSMSKLSSVAGLAAEGINGVAKAVVPTAALLGTAGAAWLLYASRIGIATSAVTEQQLASNSLLTQTRIGIGKYQNIIGKVGAGIGAAGAVYGVGTTLGSMLGDAIYDYGMGGKQQEQLRSDMQKAIELKTQQAEAAINITKHETALSFQAYRQFTLDVGKEYAKKSEFAKQAADAEVRVTKEAFSRLMSTRQQLTSELLNTSKQAWKKSDSLDDTMSIEQRDIGDADWKNYGRDGQDYVSHGLKAMQEANEALANAKDESQERLADLDQKRAEAYIEQGYALASQNGTLNMLADRTRLTRDLAVQHLDALRQQQQTQKSLAADAESRAKAAQEHTDELERQRVVIEKTLKTTETDAEGKSRFKTKEELQTSLKESDVLLKQFESDYKKFSTQDFAKPFMGDLQAFRSMRREVERANASGDWQQVSGVTSRLNLTSGMTYDEAAALRKKDPQISRMETVTGLDVASVGRDALIEAAQAKMGEYDEWKDKSKYGEERISAAQSTYDKARADLNAVPHPPADRRWRERAEMMEAVKESDTYSKNGGITSEAYSSLYGRFQQASSQIPEVSSYLASMLTSLKAQYEAEKSIPQAPSNQTELEQLRTSLSSIQSQFQIYTSEQTRQNQAIHETSQAFIDAARAIRDFSSALPQHHALGGTARGTDTIPAMLSPGETIINAASSRRFAAQLTALNAGVQPVYRESGGSTTNIGDISITIQESKTPQATTRELMAAINRQKRRGSATI